MDWPKPESSKDPDETNPHVIRPSRHIPSCQTPARIMHAAPTSEQSDASKARIPQPRPRFAFAYRRVTRSGRLTFLKEFFLISPVCSGVLRRVASGHPAGWMLRSAGALVYRGSRYFPRKKQKGKEGRDPAARPSFQCACPLRWTRFVIVCGFFFQ